MEENSKEVLEYKLDIPFNVPKEVDCIPEDNKLPVLRNYINGKFVEPKNGKYLQNINPATGEIISYIPSSKEEDVEDAANSALTCFKSGIWSDLDEETRGYFFSFYF
jgi:hypothetical protein